MRNKKLITLLACLTMSIASASAMTGCDRIKQMIGLGGDSSTESSFDISTDSESIESESTESGSTGDEKPEEKSFEVTFDAANGTASTKATVKEGEAVAKPADPTKEYYIFDGWYNGDVAWNFNTGKVTANVTLTAKWIAKEYTVQFVDFAGEVTEVKYTCENVADFALPAAPAAPQYYENARWDKVAADCTVYSEEAIVVNAVADAKVYNVQFVDKDNVGVEFKSYTCEDVDSFVAPEVPVAPQYYENPAWDKSPEEYLNYSEDLVIVKATYTAKVYTIKYIGADGSTLVDEKTYTCENIGDFAAPAVPAPEAGWTNGHWDKEPNEYLIYSEEPIIVTAEYDRPQYLVTFKNGDETVLSGDVEEGKLLTAPEIAIPDYYVFDGWYNGDTKWDFATDKVTAEVTLTAKFVAIEYTVQFVDFAGEVTELKYTCENAAEFALPAVPAAPQYYENARWDKEAAECTVYSEDPIVVNAVADETVYTVQFVDFDGNVTEKTYTYTSTFEMPEVPAAPQYYTAAWDKTLEECVVYSEEPIVVNAIKIAIEYTVEFIDFNNWASYVTYTVENAEDFALPAAPDAPEHYENARWNKTVEECVIYSEEVVTVNAIADAKVYTVTFVGADVEAQDVTYGNTATYVEAARDGFIFGGWYFDGVEYDFNALVEGDITLTAKWLVKTNTLFDYVLSAQDVYDGVQLEEGYGFKEESGAPMANPNAGWYFDSDYDATNSETGVATGTDENKFMNLAKYTLTVDGGGGKDEAGRETYLVLPAINYTLTKKVDFAYVKPGSVSSIKIYGTEVHNFEGNNKLISIVTDENGTKLYFREINSVKGDVTQDAQAVIDLPESVVNGKEGLKLNITVNGWMQISITEFHVTAYEVVASEEYENTLYEAVVNAEAASQAQVDAIEAYRAFSDKLNEDEKATAAHIANVEAINALIDENFIIPSQNLILSNDPTVDTSKGAVDQNDRIQTGWGGHHTEYNTSYETYVHMIQFTSGDYDGTATLPAINYNECIEVYFGVFAIASVNGTVAIGDGSYSFDASKGHSWKVVIKDGVLTVYDDSKGNNDGGGVIFTTTLSEDVANGAAGLVIDFNFDAWAQAEITEMHVTTKSAIKPIVSAVENVTSTLRGGVQAGEKNTGIGGQFAGSNYSTYSYVQTSDPAVENNLQIVLGNFNFAEYNEVRFGVSFAVTLEKGILTIGGESFAIPSSLIGYWYKMDAVIADGYLTLVDAGSRDDVLNKDTNYTQHGYFLKVKLSDSVLNGTEALTVDLQMGVSYARLEVTGMLASKAVTVNKVN